MGVLLHGNDFEIILASFTYPRTWCNMPDQVGQMNMTTFVFQQGHIYHDDGAITNAADGAEGVPSREGDDEAPADQHPCQGTTFIRSLVDA